MYRVLQPATISGLNLRNRFIRSATFDATADHFGAVTDQSVAVCEKLAAGGVGLIVTGYAFVSEAGRRNYQQHGIHNENMIGGLRRLVAAAHSQGAAIAAQLVHAGTLSVTNQWADRSNGRFAGVDDYDPEQIGDQFAMAAVRAQEAGFDAVQLHGAHGYVFSQFLSPLVNHRQDRWGGRLENRVRFHVEAIRKVKAAVGSSLPVMIKFGIADEVPGGVSLDEGILALKRMAEAGLDAVEISGGIATGKLQSSRVLKPDQEIVYYRSRTAQAKRTAGIPVVVVGGIRTLETAEEIVQSGDADFVGLCRPLIREPDLISRWQSGDTRHARCISCAKCRNRVLRGQPLACEQDAQERASGPRRHLERPRRRWDDSGVV